MEGLPRPAEVELLTEPTRQAPGAVARDAYQPTERVLSGGRHANVPIVGVSAHVSLDDRRALDACMNDDLTKPLDTQTLRATVAGWLDG